MSAEWGYTVEYVAGLIRGNYISTLYKTTSTSLSTARNAQLHNVKKQQYVMYVLSGSFVYSIQYYEPHVCHTKYTYSTYFSVATGGVHSVYTVKKS